MNFGYDFCSPPYEIVFYDILRICIDFPSLLKKKQLKIAMKQVSFEPNIVKTHVS